MHHQPGVLSRPSTRRRVGTALVAVLSVLASGLIAGPRAEAVPPGSNESAERQHIDAVGGDPDGDARELPPMSSAKPRASAPPVSEVGSFEDPPTGGRAPAGWSPVSTGFQPGRSVVDGSLTSPTRVVYDNPDGTHTARLSTTPVRFRDAAGRWTRYDEDLVVKGGALVPTAAPPGSEISTDPGSEVLVQAATAAGPVGLGQSDGGVQAPAVDGAVATFGDVEGSADLEVSLTPTGFETTLVVPAASEGANAFEQRLELPAGVAARSGGPGVELIDASGTLIGSYGSGTAVDANGVDVPVTTRLVRQAGSTATVEASVPRAWFGAPGRAFPVAIDPVFSTTTGSTGGLDTYVQSNSATAQSNAVNLLVGPQSTNTTIKRRALLKFDLSSIQGVNRQVLSASLDVWNSVAPSCTAKSMEVVQLSSAFSASTVWSTQPSWGTNVVSSSFAKGFSGSCPAAHQVIDVQSIVQDWMFNSTNHGFGLRAANESDGLADKTITSGESWVQPELDVTYNRPPSAGATQSAPATDAEVATTTPTLTVSQGTDPDGDDLLYWWSVSTEPDGASGQVIASGWLPQSTNGLSWTVPAGTLVDGQTYYWTVHTADGNSWPAAPPATRSFTVDLRLGSGEWPTDDFGPGSVNLTNGNLVVTHASPSFAGLGASFEYNSRAEPTSGLSASYYALFGGGTNHRPAGGQAAQLRRRDPTVSFDWASASPGPQVPTDGFYAVWKGSFLVPTTGNYKFGGSCSDGLLIKVNASSAFDRWTAGCSPTDPDPWSGLIALTAGAVVPFEVEYWEGTGVANVNLKVRGPGLPGGVGIDLPARWLTTDATRRLPAGWSSYTDLAGHSSYRSAEISTGSVNLIDLAGAGHQYGWDSAKQAWQPPEGEHGVLTARIDGTYLLADEDGLTYEFSGGGQLLAVRSAVEDTGSTAPTSTWNPADRLTTLTDPVSGRAITFAYSGSGTCTSATGFSTAPAGMLCAISYSDFAAGNTQIRYNANGQIARIEDPGGEVTDYAYDANGRISKVRDPLAADAVAASVRTDNDTTRSLITYDGSGRVSTITLPEPLASESRPAHTYTYTNATTTDVAAAGLTSTSGRLRRAVFDTEGRLTADTDLAGRTASVTYDSDGRAIASWNGATGLKSTVVYDGEGNVTDEWGPAPTSWWSSAPAGGAPTTNASSTPHTVTQYDAGLTSLAATWWSSPDLSGQPVAHATGVGDGTGRITANWGTGSPSGVAADFSGVLTGWINVPNTNVWSMKATFSGNAEVMIDDDVVVDGWTGTLSSAEGTYQGAAGWTPITIRYSNPAGVAALDVLWHDAGGTYALVPGSNLRPGYGLPTSTTDPDGRVTATSYTHAGSGLGPEDGVAVATTADPAGLALTTSEGFESSGLRRRTTRRLPTGAPSEVVTAYWGNTDIANVPCAGGDTSVNQGGQPRYRTAADPDGAGGVGAIQNETIYDKAGRPAASRVVADGNNWICTSFDARGRATSIGHPDLSGALGRIVTIDYDVSANPLQVSMTDTPTGGTARVVTAVVDLLGRARTYTDAWGNQTTSSFDQVGRPTSETSPVGTITRTPYDNDGNPGPTKLGGTTLATPHYDAAGRIDWVDYGNGTESAPTVRDSLGRHTALIWKDAAGTAMASDQLTFSLAGKAIDQVVDGNDARPSNPNFAYDAVGRLVDSWTTSIDAGGVASSLHTAYGFGTSSVSCPSGTRADAGKNTNRTSRTVGDGGGAVTTSYCYDDADRLMSSTQAGVGTPSYDSHGNTTAIWGETRAYDSSDRHVATVKGTSTVTYTRDATDRIIARKVVVGGVTGDDHRYGFSAGGDVAGFVTDTSNSVLERVVNLPGGVAVTIRSSSEVWSYPSLHGDVMAIANASGVKQGASKTYDPSGAASSAIVDNSAGSIDEGWLGGFHRKTEHAATLATTIEMGQRTYDPVLGRFLSVDPVEGGSANSYDYGAADPVGNVDTTGRSYYTLYYAGRQYLFGPSPSGVVIGLSTLKCLFWGLTRCFEGWSTQAYIYYSFERNSTGRYRIRLKTVVSKRNWVCEVNANPAYIMYQPGCRWTSDWKTDKITYRYWAAGHYIRQSDLHRFLGLSW
jgi:RHS repeat-associated protein